jgi:type IV pilus assembly protein PilX
MMRQPQKPRVPQTGIVLVSSLLLLLVVTIMALSIFRSFGIQEKIAGNTREKQRALQGAMSAQQFAESWLVTSSNAPNAVNAGAAVSADVPCSIVVDANTGGGQICSNTLASLGIQVATPPWSVAVKYTPPGMNVGSVTNLNVTDIYYDRPRFYITDMGPLASANGEVYKVDAYSYGTSANTVAVVESTFAVTCIVCPIG